MLNTVLIVGLVFAASFAQAQSRMKRPASVTPATSSATASGSSMATLPSNTSEEWYAGHVSIAAVFSNEMALKNVDVSTNGKTRGSGEFGTSQAMGLMVQWQDEWKGPWDWNMGLTYFRERQLETFRGLVDGRAQQGKLKNNPTFAPLLAHVGATFRWNDKVYSPVGLNTTIINNTAAGSLKNFSMSPQIGHQFGVGFRADRRFSAELMYQKIAYSMDGVDGTTKFGGDVFSEGLNLQGRYTY